MRFLLLLIATLALAYSPPPFWRDGARVVLVHDDGTCVSRCHNCLDKYAYSCHAGSRPDFQYTDNDVWIVKFFPNGKVALKAVDGTYLERAINPYNSGSDRFPICFGKNPCARSEWNPSFFDDGTASFSCDGGYKLARCPTCNWGDGGVYDAAVRSVNGRCDRFKLIDYDNRDGGYGRPGYGPGGVSPDSGYGPGGVSPDRGYGPGGMSPDSGYGRPGYPPAGVSPDSGYRRPSYGPGGVSPDSGRRDYGAPGSYPPGSNGASQRPYARWEGGEDEGRFESTENAGAEENSGSEEQ